MSPFAAAPATAPAGLEVWRARIRRGRLELAGAISRGATGLLHVTFSAGGRTSHFAAELQSGRGDFRLRRRLPRRQPRAGSGIVSLRYPGDANTRSQEIRLRAAPAGARLTAAPALISDGTLSAQGTITRRARGFVAIRLSYLEGDQERIIGARARIRRGRWSVRGVPVPAGALAHAYAIFTGGRTGGVGGEMRTLALTTR